MKDLFHKKSHKFTLRLLCLSAAAVVLLAALGVFCCHRAVENTEYPFYWQGRLQETGGGYACILVPGAAVNGGKPGAHLQDRLDTAAALYKAGAADTLLLSGGYNQEQQLWESRVMMVYLENCGIPRSAMLLDDYGDDTAESLRRAKALVGDGKVLLCTQSLYAPRAAYLAQKIGLELAVADSDIHIYTVGIGKAQLRETAAAAKAVWDGAFRKKCRYSLEAYPMKGGDSVA